MVRVGVRTPCAKLFERIIGRELSEAAHLSRDLVHINTSSNIELPRWGNFFRTQQPIPEPTAHRHHFLTWQEPIHSLRSVRLLGELSFERSYSHDIKNLTHHTCTLQDHACMTLHMTGFFDWIVQLLTITIVARIWSVRREYSKFCAGKARALHASHIRKRR